MVDVDIQQAEDPSESNGADSWDNQRVGDGTALDGAESARAGVEQYSETAEVVTDTWEAEDRHSR